MPQKTNTDLEWGLSRKDTHRQSGKLWEYLMVHTGSNPQMNALLLLKAKTVEICDQVDNPWNLNPRKLFSGYVPEADRIMIDKITLRD